VGVWSEITFIFIGGYFYDLNNFDFSTLPGISLPPVCLPAKVLVGLPGQMYQNLELHPRLELQVLLVLPVLQVPMLSHLDRLPGRMVRFNFLFKFG
jgi:hypothetical protein